MCGRATLIVEKIAIFMYYRPLKNFKPALFVLRVKPPWWLSTGTTKWGMCSKCYSKRINFREIPKKYDLVWCVYESQLLGFVYKSFNRKFLPILGNLTFTFLYPLICNFITSESIYHTLQHTSCSSYEIGICTPLGLSKNIERRTSVLSKGFNEGTICLFWFFESNIKDGENAICLGWSSLVYSLLVVFKICLDLVFVCNSWKGVSEKVYISLFDFLTMISSVLACNVIFQFVYFDFIRYLVVCWV